MGLTLVEKIAARHADGLPPGAVVRAGDFVSIRPRHVMTHDNTAAVMPKFKQIGATAISDPAQPVFAIDHDIQNVTPKNLEKYAKIEAFASEQGVDFYPAGHRHFAPGDGGTGLRCPRRLGRCERFAFELVRRRGGARHTGGANGCGQYLGHRRDLVAGSEGREGDAERETFSGVTGKDVIIALCGLFNKDEVLNHAVEFLGDGVAVFSCMRG